MTHPASPDSDAPHYPQVLSVATLLLPSLHRLDAHPGRVYTLNIVTNTARPEPEPNCDQLTQAVTVGLCLAAAAVLLVLALVP